MKSNRRVILSILVVIILFLVAGTVLLIDRLQERTIQSPPKFTTNNVSPSPLFSAPLTEVVAENLSVPWDIASLPGGDILFTEREGNLKRLYLSSDQHVETVSRIEDVRQNGEGGLHGIAVHPQFAENKYIYLYYTYAQNGGNTLNRVVRYTYKDNTLNDETIVVDEIPGALFHDGGRIRFGPDGFLYITTGDAQVPSLAQTKDSLAGKILRVTENGDPAPGNPFGTRIYSHGHRNPQGITWDESGNMWETEHGQSATDEINLIKPGNNYGWPTIRGNETQSGMVSPVLQSGLVTTWAPAGLTYYNSALFFGGLRGQALFEVRLKGTEIERLIPHFEGQFGRIRAVTLGPDNMLYISTSNRDGRGNPRTGDDKIIRVNPEKL